MRPAALASARGVAFIIAAALTAIGVMPAPTRAQSPSPLPERVPVNPLLSDHSKWFEPVHIYDLKKEHFPLPDGQLPPNLSYDVFSAVGYDLANTMVIRGPKHDANGNPELVIVDTLGNPGITSATIKAMREAGVLPATGKLPIRAIIYTHNHIDHAYGVQGYLDQADRPACPTADPEQAGPDGEFNVDVADPGCVAIIAQVKIDDGVGTTATVTGTIIDARSSYMYGSFIPRNQVNDGIGPQEKSPPGVEPSYRMPSRTFSQELLVTAAGVDMKIVYVPSETNDELALFLPDARNTAGLTPKDPGNWGGRGLLFSAEVIQGPAFPNLYSLRGTAYRNPATWFRSVDRLRAFDSWCMVPSHGPPLCEPGNIETLLRNFRDAIQFTHDQTIRWMNKGYTMDQLALIVDQLYLARGEEARIMRDLDNVKPVQNINGEVVSPRDYLRPFYGSVSQAVREIYAGSVGWFQADPTALRPTPPDELARRMVELMGGASKVNDAARIALGNGDPTFAAELTTNVIRGLLGNTDPVRQQAFTEARDIKARALLQLGAAAENPNWRNWYITGAFELQGTRFPGNIAGGLVSPGVVAALPVGAWVNSLTMRLRAEDTATLPGQSSLGFWFPASPDPAAVGAQGYMLVVRGGIAEFVENGPSGAPLTLDEVKIATFAVSIERAALAQLIGGDDKGDVEFAKALKQAYEDGAIKPLNGSIQDFQKAFFGWFDPKPIERPLLVLGLPTPDLAKK